MALDPEVMDIQHPRMAGKDGEDWPGISSDDTTTSVES